jgi:hypothetical protein
LRYLGESGLNRGASGGGVDIGKIAEIIMSAAQTISQLAAALITVSEGLDNSVAYTTNSVTHNYNTFDMKSSYNINDTSGRPESVAQAVDRTKLTQMRNMQGIFNTM